MPQNDDIQTQLLAVFREEQAEHSGAIRTLLAAARGGGPAGAAAPRPFSPAEFEEIYRRVHSLKGAARAVDLAEIESVAHQMESVLSRVRGGDTTVPPAMLFGLLEAALEVCEALTLVSGAGDDGEAAGAAARAAAANLLRDLESALRLEPVGASARVAPEAGTPAAPDLDAAPTDPARRRAGMAGGAGEEFVRLRAQHLDDLLTVTRQLLLEAERQRPALAELRRLERDLLGATSDSSVGPAAQPASDSLVRVRRLLRRTHRRQQDNVWRLGRVVNRLHNSVRRARTVTTDSVVEGMDRMLAALAGQTGRQADLEIAGGDIAIDRQLAQALRDPLTHLLRNTISHGIEKPAERAARGKPAAGSVSLRFAVRRARLEVEVEDDGGGIDTAELRRAAERAGLRSPRAGADLTEEEVNGLIFAPGFSTTQAADRIAGRGMGLFIVAQAVYRLGGDVRVVPKPPGTGTLFRLSLPLSLLTERLVLVDSAGRTYGIPTYAVERLYRVPAARREIIGGEETVRPDAAEPVKVVALDSLVPAGPAPRTAPVAEILPVVVIRVGRARFALSVDRFRNEVEAVIRPLGPYLAGVTLVNGSVILEDGNVALALVPAELAARAARLTPQDQERSRLSVAEASVAIDRTGATGLPRTILVVDDSITTRALMTSILEAQEYDVRIATDGAEALSVLRDSANRRDSPVHLVVSDIEMPRMNGFDLLRAVKEDPRLAPIPVILVTSKEAFEDRETGLSLGADAYLVKQRFDHRELLDAIEQLVL